MSQECSDTYNCTVRGAFIWTKGLIWWLSHVLVEDAIFVHCIA